MTWIVTDTLQLHWTYSGSETQCRVRVLELVEEAELNGWVCGGTAASGTTLTYELWRTGSDAPEPERKLVVSHRT